MILAIDCASSTASVALGGGDEDVVRWHAASERGWSESLLDRVAELLAEAGRAPGDPRPLGPVRGPGSFTGVRIGLSIALGLHQSLGSRAGTVSTHDALEQWSRDQVADLPDGSLTAVDALRGGWFVRRIPSSPRDPVAASAVAVDERGADAEHLYRGSDSDRGVDDGQGIVRVTQDDPLLREAPLVVGFGVSSLALKAELVEPSALAPAVVRLAAAASAPVTVDQPHTLSRPLYLQDPELRRSGAAPAPRRR